LDNNKNDNYRIQTGVTTDSLASELKHTSDFGVLNPSLGKASKVFGENDELLDKPGNDSLLRRANSLGGGG